MKDWLETRTAPTASHPVVAPLTPATTTTPILWAETWSLALQELRGNKVRAALTMLGVIIGSACIVLVVTVALVGKRYVVGQIEGVGVNLIHAELVHTGDAQRISLADEINLADMDAVQAELPHVTVVAGSHDMPMTFVVNGVSRPVSLVGVTEGFQTIRRFLIIRGRYFDEDDMNSRSKVCLITRELAELAFPDEDPLGKDIRLGDLHFTVIGVFHERTATFGLTEVTRNSVIVPIGLIKYYTGEEYLRTLYVQADRPENVPELTKQVGQLLSGRHRRGAEYLSENLDSLLDSARRISLALTVLLIVVATIALTISGIGIMNIMLVTVTERTREIGIRKAIGAPRVAILYQFLMEALLISGTGAVLGIAIAVAIPAVLNIVISLVPELSGIHIPVSWVSVVLAFLVSCSTGVLFGYLPANRAARLHPTESLRYE
ncbi:MAG TPA: ABC transporter permease [Candidatus Acidoferrales bacterium]